MSTAQKLRSARSFTNPKNSGKFREKNMQKTRFLLKKVSKLCLFLEKDRSKISGQNCHPRPGSRSRDFRKKFIAKNGRAQKCTILHRLFPEIPGNFVFPNFARFCRALSGKFRKISENLRQKLFPGKSRKRAFFGGVSKTVSFFGHFDHFDRIFDTFLGFL